MDLLNLGDNQFIERMLSSRLISVIETYRIVVNDVRQVASHVIVLE
jgi:hypothetical protein